MAETPFLGRFIQHAGARLRDYHAESKPGFCFLFECQGGDLGLAFPAAREGVNRTNFTSALQMGCSLVSSLPNLRLGAVTSWGWHLG